jgi:hypothetical protein
MAHHGARMRHHAPVRRMDSTAMELLLVIIGNAHEYRRVL